MRALFAALVLSLLMVPQISSHSDQRFKDIQPSQDDSIVFGNATVRSASNGNIVVIIDQTIGNVAPDGIPDLVFRFAPKKKKARYQNVSLEIEQAKIFFTDRRLAVLSNDGHMMISLTLEKVEDLDASFVIYGDRSSDLARTIRITNGIALQRRQIRRDSESLASINLEESIIISRRENGEMRSQDDEFELDNPCKAGGPGATSCSLTCRNGQCSVSCGSGYYACCYCVTSEPSCQCIRN